MAHQIGRGSEIILANGKRIDQRLLLDLEETRLLELQEMWTKKVWDDLLRLQFY
jgi:hypothetical protein